MSQFIEIVESSPSGSPVRHVVNVAHVVELCDHSAYNVVVALVNGTRISVNRAHVASISAALLGTETSAPVAAPHTLAFTTRLDYCDTAGASRDAYLVAQRELFKVSREHGLNTDARDEMLTAISAFIGEPITSRKQLTPREMNRLCYAIERGDLTWRFEIRKAA